MKLKKISYSNFRNLKDGVLELAPDITILKGKNAQGKTNILESVYLLALTKSFRTKRSLDLIRWEENYVRVLGDLEVGEDGEKEVARAEVYYEREPRKRSKFALDKKAMLAKDYVGSFKVVTFIPDDVQVLTGSPSHRRRYIDILLSQVDREYLYLLSDYSKTIKERNALLGLINARKATAEELFFWDSKLVEFGEPLMKKRREAISFFSQHLTELLQKISSSNCEIDMKYKPSVPEDGVFEEYLAAHQDSDIIYKSTRKGPHRDDFTIIQDGRSVGEFGSRGEVRSALLALKMCEMLYIYEKTETKPVLLLDDVFSELDTYRQKALLEMIEGHQTIITTTDQFSESSNALIYDVEEGLLTKI